MKPVQNKFRVVTGIVIVLALFCSLQLITGGLFYSAVNKDNEALPSSRRL
ncbi:Tar ligand binding domain-containing protein [Scandinavium sp.]|nr:Tar ligand binding domain-containing protein [Scandinavium sp.]